MKYLALSLLIGFIAINIFGFGFMSMSHEGGHVTGNCIASTIDKTICPQNSLIVALHHISAYQTFSQAVPSYLYTSLLLTLALFVIGYIFLKNLFPQNSPTLLLQRVRSRRNEPELYLHQPRKIIRWLSLFENSPSLQ